MLNSTIISQAGFLSSTALTSAGVTSEVVGLAADPGIAEEIDAGATQATAGFVSEADDEIQAYGRLLSGSYLGDNEKISEPPNYIEPDMKVFESGGGVSFRPIKSTDPQTTQHRTEKYDTTYYPGVVASVTELMPSPMHCQLDALRLVHYLWNKFRIRADILEIRSVGPSLQHYFSVWTQQGLEPQKYDGIHFAVVYKGCVFDLQTKLPWPINLATYLRLSFGSQKIKTKSIDALEFQQALRVNRHFKTFRDELPELGDDYIPGKIREQRTNLLQIMQAARDRRKPEKTREIPFTFPEIFTDDTFPYR